MGARISSAMVLRLWARIRGSMARRTWPPPESLPVNMARPMVAENPQKNVAAAMKQVTAGGMIQWKWLVVSG